MSGFSADMLNKLTKADLYEIALANGKRVGFFLEDNEVSKNEFTTKLQEYCDETNGGKIDLINIILKIQEKEYEALENVVEEDDGSNTGTMEKAFKILAEKLHKDFVKVKKDIEGVYKEEKKDFEKVNKDLDRLRGETIIQEQDLIKKDGQIEELFKKMNFQNLNALEVSQRLEKTQGTSASFKVENDSKLTQQKSANIPLSGENPNQTSAIPCGNLGQIKSNKSLNSSYYQPMTMYPYVQDPTAQPWSRTIKLQSQSTFSG